MTFRGYWLLILLFFILICILAGWFYIILTNLKENAWPKQVKKVEFVSSADFTMQPGLFYAPVTDDSVPLLVALHVWSGDYKNKISIPFANWCIENKWAFIHPDFRGPNNRPEATGSELVIKDILSAVDYAKSRAKIDLTRIYLVGVSGGGYSALMAAGKSPEIWAGISVWGSIADLRLWYFECKKAKEPYIQQYAKDIFNSCGGAFGESSEIDLQYITRSPITFLKQVKNLPPIDINAGIRDGHTGSVPIKHSLILFNTIASKQDSLTEEEIEYFVERAEVPANLRIKISDPNYGEKTVLFRRNSGIARITIFDGGHDIVYNAALSWLSKQKRF